MNQTIDPWNRVIEEFFSLSKIDAKLSRFGKKWKIHISGYENGMYEWVNETALTWPDVEKVQDYLIFDDRRTAEKFITLFNLKWAR